LLQHFSSEIHFWSFSQNRGAFWSFELIDHYKDSLDWLMLSENPSLPWQNRQFIGAFQDRFHLQTLYANANYRFDFEKLASVASSAEWAALSRNTGLSLSPDRLSQYADSWNWSLLSANPAVQWDRRLVSRYHAQIDWVALAANPNVQWDFSLIDTMIAQGQIEYLSENPSVWNWLCRVGLSTSRERSSN
jgi:hypothetical protein